jgi:phosphate transport system permease protein
MSVSQTPAVDEPERTSAAPDQRGPRHAADTASPTVTIDVAADAGQDLGRDTVLPAPTEPPATLADARPIGVARKADRYLLLGAAAAAVSLTGVIYTQVAPFDGVLGFVVLAFALYVAAYSVLLWLDEPGPAIRDRLAAVFVHSLAGIMLLALAVVVVFTFVRGFSAMRHLNFYTQDMGLTGPLQPLTDGGVIHAVAGTFEQISIALVVTVPLGVVCAVFLSEIPGAFSRLTRIIVEAMTALPSIVAGLFIYATLVLLLGVNRSGIAAGLAISVMMLPIVIRAADVVLRLVPGNLREASYALGASQWRTVWHVVLPTARSGLTTAVILGTARGIGETSPVLLTAGFTANLNLDPLSGSQVSLPLFTFNSVSRPEETMIARGFGGAAVLMALVLVLFAIARVFGGRPAGELSRRQRQRRAFASRRDAHRFVERARGRIGGPHSFPEPDASNEVGHV